MSRDFQLPGRSPVIACDGMAATSHPLATLVAVDILRDGGTAADAAVAACATLCVVEPHMTGIGGDCYALVSKPGKPVWGYNGSGRAGAKASAEALRSQGLKEIGDSIHAVTVPGALDAWDALLKAHGRFGLDRLLQRAIHYAENGWPVAARVAWDWRRYVGKLGNDAGASKHYLFDGQPPKEGDIVKSPALGQTLRTLGQKGARAFYEGELADDMAQTLAAKGSFLTAEDFSAHRGNDVTPVSTNYRGLDLVEIPPNGQGIVALIMLNILENFDLKSFDPLGPERFHLQIEAARLGYAIRDSHLADIEHMRIKVGDLIDKGFAKKLAAQIDINKRAEFADAPTPGGDTIYLTVVDKDRTAVSFINSLYSAFGLGVCTEKSGIMLTNRGACFTLEPDHANTFGPNKRPMHTIIPGMTMKDGRCDMSFGVMGGSYQPMGHAQIVLNMLDYGMDVQEAIDCPRFMFEDGQVLIEHGAPQKTIDGLKARGHLVADATLPWGGAQTVQIDWQRGVLIAGSEPRKDGLALGY
ncbi:gamma-glutamyltransferase [Undibacter mobilis]|uniref:Glutathione hydrolase proenzyme n=1 Tax=Undibacter mobilis TaxID=2292256 RepID=A0A371BDL5_9BRAD|nr:gamma-glutamyltransferase [Undibacter mobilis]RDV05689.1 gamma-glutamyltransferase [Undibacter mobilis]